MGADVTLRHGCFEVQVDSRLGGSCTRLRYCPGTGAQSYDVLSALPAGSCDPFEAACFALLPYSNRLFGGQLLVPGSEPMTLAPNCNRIDVPVHGVGWMYGWTIASISDHQVDLTLHHEPNHYWPFEMMCTQRITVTDDGVRFEASVCNITDVAMPAGLGFHPRVNLVPNAKVALNAQAVWQQDEGGYPTINMPVNDVERFDYRTARSAQSVAMNHCFALWSGLAQLDLPDIPLTVHLSASPNLCYLMVYRKSEMPWLCIEPVSHATGAFSLATLNTPAHGTQWLAPGETLAGWMDLQIV